MQDRQDIRLAVVMNGGVSLAVWMSGVAAEMNRLVAASRQGAPRGPGYAALLDLLEATATVDVISGTSAGGINGGFLAVGVGLGGSLDGLGRLWADKGGLADLLRDPLEPEPASLLQGDGYFLPALREAYDDLFRQSREAGGGGNVDLYLTGTLYAGRRTRFADDMGVGIDEIDHDATFHFGSDGSCPAGDLRQPATMAKLAAASRCTSSFPGAFEPHFVTVADPAIVDDQDARRWDTDAGPATFDGSQYVIDGGILLNKPIRPALEAIYRKPAEWDVRRVLAYVAPTPGQRADPVGEMKPPRADEVVLSVLTRLRTTDSVSRELAEIRRTNEEVRERRATRARLVAVMTRQATELACDPAVWQGYQQERRRLAARTIARLIVGSAGDNDRWSLEELTASILRQPPAGLTFVPPDADPKEAFQRTGGDWMWGQTTVDRLGAIALDVLKRAMAAIPRTEEQRRTALAKHRVDLYDVLGRVWAKREELNSYWRDTAQTWPVRDDGTAALDAWTGRILAQWSDAEQRAALYQQACDIAGVLTAARVDLTAPPGTELAALIDYLGDSNALPRMLMLDVVHVALAGVLDQPEQEVELVQVSAQDPSLLTAVQAHHFGAFYRRSWRVNDWLRGRVDGTVRLCEILLSPVRLQQLAFTADTAFTALKSVATGAPGTAEHAWQTARWDEDEAAIRAELAYLTTGERPPPRLPVTARHVARRVQLEFLAEELSRLAEALHRDEPDAAWLREYQPATGHPETAFRLFTSSDEIGRQRLAEQVGTDGFARVSSQAAAVGVNIAAATPQTRPAKAVLRALRGYTLLLWTAVQLVTSQGRAGPRIVGFAVALGSAAIALSLFAPAVPMIVVLLGVLLVLAGVTTGALLTPPGRRIGRRLVPPLVLLVAAVVALAWYERDVFTVALLVKSAVVTALILLGSYVGLVHPKAKKT